MKDNIQEALKNLGLSEKEALIYLFLGKKGPARLGTITKQLKMNRGQTYRILKKLQENNLIETTLESPARFTAVPINRIIDSTIRSKQEEIFKIEKTKNELISKWDSLKKNDIDSSLERFSVIEGKKKIFTKINQMVNDAQKEFVSIVDIEALLNFERLGIFENIANSSSRNKIKFKFLTKLTDENLKAIESLNQNIKQVSNIKIRCQEINSTSFPKIIIKDKNEIILFISDENDRNQEDAVLCTNCKSIIKSFSTVFSDQWKKSLLIKKKVSELSGNNGSSIMELIENPKVTKKRYLEALNNANEEVIIITSSEGLVKLSKHKSLLEDLSSKDVKIKIMAPITTQNLDSMQGLLELSEVRHLPVGYFDLTLIDGKFLFQFNSTPKSVNNKFTLFNMENALFTNDFEYIQRTKKSLFDLWKKLHTPKESMQSINFSHNTPTLHNSIKITDRYGKEEIQYNQVKISEDEIIAKVATFRKNNSSLISNNSWEKNLYFFGSRAFCLINPPKFLKLPKFVAGAFQNSDFSSFGEENGLRFFIKLEGNPRYQQVAIVTDNSESIDYKKKAFKGMPGQKNIILLKKNQLKIIVKENVMFVGWTIPIPLVPEKYVLPPGCILFETYGSVNSGVFKMLYPSNREQEVWYNNLDAFATYFHPKLNLIHSGTEAFVDRNVIQISHPLP